LTVNCYFVIVRRTFQTENGTFQTKNTFLLMYTIIISEAAEQFSIFNSPIFNSSQAIIWRKPILIRKVFLALKHDSIRCF
jgi:hypothetical protein